MATARHTYRPAVEPRSDSERSPEQVAREEALHEVEETLLNIEQAIKRADRGRRAIRGDGNDNLRLSLEMSRSSTIKGDPRYTNTSCFETFPWPYPVTDDQRKRVAEARRAVITRRHEICVEANIGLTALYNAVDDGAYTDLRAMHDELSAAVAAAYGWPASISHDG